MARFNPYQNSQIADSISGIAKALIGSADTDAALARGRASDALAGYRNSQTNYQNQLSDYLGANTQAIADVLADGDQVKQLYEAFGLKSNIGQSIPDGGVGDMIAPNDVTPAATDGMRGLVRSMLFGGVPGNPQQSAAAGQALADMVNQQEAYRLLSQSGQSPDRQAAIRLGRTLSEYFDPNSKQNEINADLAAALNEDKARFGVGGQGDRDTNATNKTNLEIENIKATSEEKQTTITATAEKEWQNYKTDVGLTASKNEADKKLEGENYKTNKEFELGKLELTDKTKTANKKITEEEETARLKISEDIKFEKWKVENETLEMVVEPGKQIVLSPKAGERLGITPNDQGLYMLDGGPKRDAVTIEVGDEDVYLTKDQAEAIGIKPNDDGIYMIPGKAKAGSKTANNTYVGKYITQPQEKELRVELDNKVIASLPDLDTGKQTSLITYMVQKIDLIMGKPDSNLVSAKAAIMAPILGSGTTVLSVKGKNITVPSYFAERFDIEYSKYKAEPTPAKLEALRKSIKNTYKGIGYSANEVTRILRNFK